MLLLINRLPIFSPTNTFPLNDNADGVVRLDCELLTISTEVFIILLTHDVLSPRSIPSPEAEQLLSTDIFVLDIFVWSFVKFET